MIVRYILQAVVLFSLLAGASPTAADTVSSTFGYDADGRLTTGLYSSGKCVIYAFDDNGNRISQRATAKDASPPVWGQVAWNGFNWTSGSANPIWGSGAWGCFSWSTP